MLLPRSRMVFMPSSSLATSPGSLPMPMFQYEEPTTIIWPIRKKALRELNT